MSKNVQGTELFVQNSEKLEIESSRDRESPLESYERSSSQCSKFKYYSFFNIKLVHEKSRTKTSKNVNICSTTVNRLLETIKNL